MPQIVGVALWFGFANLQSTGTRITADEIVEFIQGGEGFTSWKSIHPGTQDRVVALHKKWEALSKYEQHRLANYTYPVQ